MAENSWNFWRKSTGICIKKQDHRDMMNDFDWAGKSKQPACKTLGVWTKNEENFEKISRKFWDFWSKSLWKNWLFSQFFTKYFLDFWLRSESIDLWKIIPDFYNNFSDFGGGVERSGVPPPPPPPDATGSSRSSRSSSSSSSNNNSSCSSSKVLHICSRLSKRKPNIQIWTFSFNWTNEYSQIIKWNRKLRI